MLENFRSNLNKSSSIKDSSFPMDFLQTLVCKGGGSGGHRDVKEEPAGEENVELGLGLSLNGRFGVKHNYDNKDRLIRTSSVADLMSFPSAGDDSTQWPAYPPLTRTCSVPTETEEEWKNRKELQSLRRSEAKRKRVEKLKNVTVVNGGQTAAEENCEAKRRRNELWGSSPASMLPPLPWPPVFPSPLSVGSPGSGESSGVSDLESSFSGVNKDTELNSTAIQKSVSMPYRTVSFGSYRSNKVNAASEHASDRFSITSSQTVNRSNSTDETLKTMLADMPCVSTKGDGLNGKKVEGFLYRYKKGEEVRIICVCHGSFLTPTEFVKHSGGGDVEHPLRHIVVNPFSL